MNRLIAVVAAVVAGLLVAAFGYFVGVKSGSPDQAEIAAAVEGYIAGHPELMPAGPAAPSSTADRPLDESQAAASS